MARVVRIRKGLDVPISGLPRQIIDDGPAVGSVAVLGSDYVDMKPAVLVSKGDRVALGQPLIEDGANPGALITSPAGGTVVAVNRGPRRRLESLVVEVGNDDERSFPSWPCSALEGLDSAVVRRRLLESGLWVAFRARPGGRVPGAAEDPAAIFVTAIDTEPLAPDPAVVVDASPQAFEDGLRILSRLTPGTVFLCTAQGGLNVDADVERVETVAFGGPHPAGLVGTHIHHLHPVRQGDQRVWYIGYQDVIAIGRLFVDGRLDPSRVIALAGPRVRDPRLIRSRLGAYVHDLVAGALHDGPSRLVSGSVLSGRRAVNPVAFLGRYHRQVSVLPETARRRFLGWLAPGLRTFSASRMFASSLVRGGDFPMSTSQHGSPRAMVPIGSYERVMPLDILITPLLKALLVGDTETARLLGCLELEEEDLALCSFVCCSKYEFGPALRDVLASIERNG